MMDGDGKLKRFGRYLLLDHIGDGGMAKICRARFLSDDVDRMVAIKMVQSQFAEDENFKKMFLNEIKLMFGLVHPNIAQTYDYGFYDDQFYTAMELVDGKNLRDFLRRLAKNDRVFPIEIVVYIISQVCQGLLYAHNYGDKFKGKKLNLIHRDISPQNIMLSYDGSVKIIDFGIAKHSTEDATTTTTVGEASTRVGVIKGKLSYLAPEYLDGTELDHRYDQFAVGVTMWELLCSQKLFQGKNDISVLKKIQECKITPPSHINPNVPPELDEITMKALAKNRDDRYQDVDQLNRALVKFLYAKYKDFNSSDVASFAKLLFNQDITRDQAKILEFGKIDIAPYLDDWKNEYSGQGGDEKSDLGSDGTSIRLLDFNEDETKESDLITLSKLPEERTFHIRRQKKIDEEILEENEGSKKMLMAMSFMIFTTLLLGGGFFLFDKTGTSQKLLSLVGIQSKAQRAPASKITGKLKLRGIRPQHKLYINGEHIYDQLFFVQLPLNQEHEMRVTEKMEKTLC